MLSVRWAQASDVGRVRQVNEDACFGSERLFAVADGMGGHAAGDVASQLAIAAIEQLAGQPEIEVADLLATVQLANAQILRAAAEQPAYGGMGTTLTGLAVVQVSGREHWAVFNVGDSRVYRYAEATLRQLTVDHSAVQELVDAGQLTDSQARHHPRRNVVTRSLGSDPAPLADVELYEPVLGDRLLLCSDGLTNELLDAEIAQVLQVLTDPAEVVAELVRRANQSGGRDNTTVVVVDVTAT
ncbi:MAG: Stp1/IreP family PP2C-type Ser/Thr phosphatase [Jatrophihabitans sp.]